ncbi:MAG: hypothetical protein GC206_11885 [Alphaproteobacteria bacterium]|nr:hypothetical protein [Alphaproteobacteria bacterium]
MNAARARKRDQDRPRYYREKGANAFWAPGAFAAQFGFAKSQPLGPAGADAKAAAIKLNEKLDAARRAHRAGETAPARYKPGSLGAFYEAFQRGEAWGQMEKRTREDYERAWPHIEKRFGDALVSRITADQSERFHVEIHPAHANPRDKAGLKKLPWNTAHRTLKVWRALLTALEDYEIRDKAPIGRVTNPAPPPRAAIWLADEIERLIAAADEIGLHGVAIAIRLAWDAMLSPIDALTLPAGGFIAAAAEIRTRRKKSSRAVFAAVTEETVAAVAAYLARFDPPPGPDEPLIRNRQGAPYAGPHAKKYFERDFRRVREAAFPGDRRQLLDVRRSAITEGRMGGATLDDLGAAAANNLGADQALQSTYALSAARNVHEARQKGRAAMAAKFRKTPA